MQTGLGIIIFLVVVFLFMALKIRTSTKEASYFDWVE